MTTNQESRLEYMRPHQLKACRAAADIAFLPLGILEWHGLQNPLGLDGTKAHEMCLIAARELGGGAVCPPLIWGVPRDSFNVGISGPTAAPIAEALGVEPKRWRGFALHGGMDVQEQWLFYQRLLRMTLEHIAGFGFRSIYICSGHGPFIHFIEPVCCAFTRASQLADCTVTTDWGGGLEAAGIRGDHAGKVETSIMIAIDRESVDLTTLESQPEYRGIGAGADADQSTAEQGQQWLEACGKAMAEEARWLVNHYPKLPARHQHLR